MTWINSSQGLAFLAHPARICRKASGPVTAACPSVHRPSQAYSPLTPMQTAATFVRATSSGLMQESVPAYPSYCFRKVREMHKRSEYWCKSFECFWLQVSEYALFRIFKEVFVFSHKVLAKGDLLVMIQWLSNIRAPDQ